MADNGLQKDAEQNMQLCLAQYKHFFSFQFCIFAPPSNAFAPTFTFFSMTILFVWFTFQRIWSENIGDNVLRRMLNKASFYAAQKKEFIFLHILDFHTPF